MAETKGFTDQPKRGVGKAVAVGEQQVILDGKGGQGHVGTPHRQHFVARYRRPVAFAHAHGPIVFQLTPDPAYPFAACRSHDKHQRFGLLIRRGDAAAAQKEPAAEQESVTKNRQEPLDRRPDKHKVDCKVIDYRRRAILGPDLHRSRLTLADRKETSGANCPRPLAFREVGGPPNAHAMDRRRSPQGSRKLRGGRLWHQIVSIC